MISSIECCNVWGSRECNRWLIVSLSPAQHEANPVAWSRQWSWSLYNADAQHVQLCTFVYFWKTITFTKNGLLCRVTLIVFLPFILTSLKIKEVMEQLMSSCSFVCESRKWLFLHVSQAKCASWGRSDFFGTFVTKNGHLFKRIRWDTC